VVNDGPRDPSDGDSPVAVSGLSEAEEEFLFALQTVWHHSNPSDPARIFQLASLTHATDENCGDVARRLHELGLVRFSEVAPGLPAHDLVSFTDAGWEALHDLGAVPALGRVEEFARVFDELQLAVLDAVVQEELRHAGGSASRRSIRIVVRSRVLPRPEGSAVDRTVDGLIGSYLAPVGGDEPSCRVALAGLLASDWGANAIAVAESVWIVLARLIGKNPSAQQYPWSAVRQTAGIPEKALNLAHLAITLADLGKGRSEHDGDKWWTVPPDPDVLLEKNDSAFAYLRKLVVSATTKRTAVPGVIPIPSGGPVRTEPETSTQVSTEPKHATASPIMAKPHPDPKKVFIIHGRNVEARKQVGIFLKSLGLAPVNFDDLRASLKGTPTLADIIIEGMRIAQGIVALFTPDEFSSLRPGLREHGETGDTVERWQARPNVLFEAGMAFGKDRERVVLVKLGKVSLFTDVGGIHVLSPTNDPKGHRDTLRKTLKEMGCSVDLESSDWMHEGDFETCIKALPEVSTRSPFSEAPLGTDAPAQVLPGVILNLSYKKLPTSDGEIHYYELAAVLRNGGKKRIDDWYMEVELPSPLEEPHMTVGTRVRSQAGITLFRTSDRLKPILVGEEFKYTIPYRMDNEVFDQFQGVLDQWTATGRAFVGGAQIAEVTLKEIQNF
jgi:predicted nucleotide-binding protein